VVTALTNPARLLLYRCVAKHVVRLLQCHEFVSSERPSRARDQPSRHTTSEDLEGKVIGLREFRWESGRA
jgi:hypothetical protein